MRSELNRGRREAARALPSRDGGPLVLAEEILQHCRYPVGLAAVVRGGVAGPAYHLTFISLVCTSVLAT
jgi:hypothetical protein